MIARAAVPLPRLRPAPQFESVVGCGICPNCSANLTPDRPEVIDGWTIYPSGVMHGMQSFALSATEAIILHSIARGQGRFVASAILEERAALPPGASLKVTVSKIRSKIPGVPIQSGYGLGYRWQRADDSLAGEASWLRQRLTEIEAQLAELPAPPAPFSPEGEPK